MQDLTRISITIALIFLGVISLAGLIPLANEITSMRSDVATESESCTTGVGQTSCDVTLDSQHLFEDSTGLAVTETSPGSGSLTSTLTPSDQVTLTIEGLSASTSYAFSINYLTEKEVLTEYGLFNDLLQMIPNIVVLMVVGLSGLGVLTVNLPP